MASSNLPFRVVGKGPVFERQEELYRNDRYLEGINEQAFFSKFINDELIASLSLDEKFQRLIGLGNTAATYTDWTHVRAESGYSIWKIAITNFQDNANNNMYLDSSILEYEGEATSESLTSFDKVFIYDASVPEFDDNTTEAASEGGTPFILMEATADFLYIGAASVFAGIDYILQTRGANYTLKLEYSKGSGVWEEMSANSHVLVDNTRNFANDGTQTWTASLLTGWATDTVNSQVKYWIRVSTSTVPVTNAFGYTVVPFDSVPALLSLSPTQIQLEEWKWCFFNDFLYVTIRNTGNVNKEGSFYINSNSTAANKENFFVWNHQYKTDYEDSSYQRVSSQRLNNLLTNGDFALWGSGPTSAPTGWTDLGTAATIGQSTGSFVVSSLAVNYTNGASNTGSLAFSVTPVSDFITPVGATISFNAYAIASAASRVRVALFDDVNGFTYSSYHSGGGGWEKLAVAHTVATGATVVRAEMRIETGTAITATWDAAAAWKGDMGYEWTPTVVDKAPSIKLNLFAPTTSAELAEVISDETGSGVLVFSDAPTFTGQVPIPTIDLTGGQIAFPATQVPSADPNTLDDYEEGNFTPTWEDTSHDDEGQNYTTQIGRYTKIGNTVFVRLLMRTGGNKGTMTGGDSVYIGGLPFAAGATNARGVFTVHASILNLSNARESLVGYAQSSASYVELYKWSATTGVTLLTVDELEGGSGAEVRITGFYEI